MACIDQNAVDKGLEDDRANMNIPEEHEQRNTVQDHLVFACNWRALEVFLNSTTQWRRGPSGEIHALDYTAVNAVMQMMDIPPHKRADTFTRVRLVEAGALGALHKMNNRKRPASKRRQLASPARANRPRAR